MSRLDGDVVIEIKGEAKGIKSRTKIGGCGWDTNPEWDRRFHDMEGNRKNFSAAEVVSRAISSKVVPRREATLSATNLVYAGSHRLPRWGSGER